MNYQNIYDTIIEKSKNENRKKGLGIYYESHHIVPKCLGGLDNKYNRVLLTAREHFVCHKLLFFANPSNKKLGLAYHSLTYTMQNRRKIKLSSRDFELARVAAYMASNGKNNPRFGIIMSDELKNKISKSNTGKPAPNLGIKHSDETRAKISKANKGKLLGRPKSKETRAKMSKWQRGIKRIGCIKIKKRKPISAISPLGHYMEFHSGLGMAKMFGLDEKHICHCLKGKGISHKGWTNFKYISSVQA